MLQELSSLLQNTPLRSSLPGANTKKRKSNSITGPSAFDEENVSNKSTTAPSDKSNLPKKTKVAKMAENYNKAVAPIDAESEYLKSQYMRPKPSPSKSECGTEVSVSERREWLKQFEQKQTSNALRKFEKEKQRKNDERNNSEKSVESKEEQRESPPASVGSSHSTRSIPDPVEPTPPVISAAMLKPVSAKKPRNKPRLVNNRRASSGAVPSWVAQRKEDVKATDEGFASVASLSKWLENDPTSSKKKIHVRRGRNIVSKSRQFESGNDNIIFEAKISRGAVGDKKKWLQNAFQSEEDEDDACSSFSGYVKSDVGRSTMRTYPRFNQRYGAQTEIITDDAASSLSVSDKKEWLKKAFVTNSDDRKSFGYNKAQTDVMHNRGQDEAVSRAKLRFKERSARKLMASNPTTRPSVNEDRAVQPIEEDTTPVDFSAARDALIERSNKNGHDAQVVNKVYLRKKNIERREDESRRKSMHTGLVLKPSWESDASGSYEKKFVPVTEIAPKTSFEDLP